jgi:outer membrane protein assembly factor BamA
MGKFLLILVLLITTATAQDKIIPNEPVLAIVIIGNHTTDDNVIRRELLFKEGDIITETEVRESQERLLNLYLFNRVEIYTIPQEQDGVLLVIEVTERLYFYPVPILNIQERDWDKWSYGLGVIHYNFRGQNERVWAGMWFGYRPGFGFSYTDQWAGDSLHLTTGFRLSKVTFDHRTLNFEERHILAEATVGKWWNFYFKTDLTLSFDRISVNDEFSPLLKSGQSTEYLLGVLFSVRHDTRDIYTYPQNGWFNRLFLFKNGIFQEFNNYYRVSADTRRYVSFGPVTFAGRWYQSYLFGDIPVYRYTYIGFDERIRGHFSEVREGKHINVAGLAIRFPIIPIRYFSLSLPGIPDLYTTNLKLGLSGGFFIDSGIVWDEAPEYQWNNFRTGFGFGLHFHLPYIEVFRIDYAMDRDWNGEIIAEIGLGF